MIVLNNIFSHILDRKALTIARDSLLLDPATVRLTLAYNFSILHRRVGTLVVVDPTTAAGLAERGDFFPSTSVMLSVYPYRSGTT